MSLAARITAAIRKIESVAVLLNEDGSAPAFTASVQPRTGSAQENAGPLGAFRPRTANLYASPGELALSLRPGFKIACDGIHYRVLQSEIISVSGTPLFVWAALEALEEAAI